MIREIKAQLYRLRFYNLLEDIYIEAETKKDLFLYIIEKERKGMILTNVSLILRNGKTPKFAFRNDPEYKKLKR